MVKIKKLLDLWKFASFYFLPLIYFGQFFDQIVLSLVIDFKVPSLVQRDFIYFLVAFIDLPMN